MTIQFQSEHFTLQPLADGVYAAIATEGGAASSNAGVIDLGDQTLIFDAFENPQAAEDLLLASLQLTRRAPSTVILSHFHPDHWGGLQEFAGAAILATKSTRQAMLPLAEQMLEDKKNPSGLQTEIRNYEALLETETDPIRRKWLHNSLSRMSYSLQALPTLEPTLPNLTFDGQVTFHGTKRSVELVAVSKGHTQGDCLLLLPQERLAFIGDLAFFQAQPYMANSHPDEWLKLLDEMAGWEIETFVPGHGPVGGKQDLALQVAYIHALEEMVKNIAQSGGTVEDALSQTLPAPFDAWQKVGRRFELNVRAAFERYR